MPRTADGVELEKVELEGQIADIEQDLALWEAQYPEVREAFSKNLISTAEINTSVIAFWGRAFHEWRYRLSWWVQKRRLDAQLRQQAQTLNQLFRKRRLLQRQISSLILARKLLSLWHTIHIPIGLALFSLAFVHIVAAVYYATLLR